MDRRGFVRGAFVTLALGPAVARAQACPRAEWSPAGPLTGHEPADAESMTDLERSHVPVLTLPRHVHLGRSFDLAIQIGLRPHEMSTAHHVEWIEVALDERRIAVVDLTPGVPFPIVRIPVVVHEAGTLVARARCNQHGVWMTRRALAVG